MSKRKHGIQYLNHLPAIRKLLIAIGFCLFFSLSLVLIRMEVLTRIMISWDVFSLLMISLSAITFFTMEPRQIRLIAKSQDASRPVVFLIVLISTVGSLFGVFLLLVNRKQWVLNQYLETFIYIFGVICSWFLLHVMFAYRYAHLYYGDRGHQEGGGGLEIPGESCPDYLDFAYFSFVIGMTFQVSDINVLSRKMRRLALLQGLLSFLFNTVIVAVSINVILDLKS